jgi:hypothetical protein
VGEPLSSSSAEDAQFQGLLTHLETVVKDLEQIHSLKELSEEAKLDVIGLVQAAMSYADISSIAVPTAVLGDLAEGQAEKPESAELTQSGVVVFRRKGGETKASHFSEYKPSVVVRVLGVLVPFLKDEIANRRKAHEKQLEALQSIKQSLSAVEKRRRPTRQREQST